MHKIFRCILVAVLTFGMTVNVSSAGRLFQRGCPKPVCCPVVECACPPVSCSPVVICCESADFQDSPQPTTDPLPDGLEPDEVEAEKISPAITPGPVDDSSSNIEPTKMSSPEPAIDIPVAPLGVPPMPETPAEPSVQPPATDTEDDLQDMFDTPTPSDDVEEMVPEDDLFGSSEPEKTAEPAPTAAEPVEVESAPPTEADPLDELFDSPDKPEVPENSEAPENSEESDIPHPEEDSFDDLFGQVVPPAELSTPGGLLSNLTRQWTDDTAKYQCEARLVHVMKDKVVLANARGSELAVSLARLSDDDLKFVHQQVVAKRALLASQAAGEKLASAFQD